MKYTKEKIKKILDLTFGKYPYQTWVCNSRPHIINTSVYQVVSVDYVFKNDGKTIAVIIAISE